MKIIVNREGKLLEYLYDNLDLPKKKIKQYLTHGAIYVNNNKITKYDYKLLPGENIIIDTENKIKKILPFDIIFEDQHIIVVNKPSGLLTIATEKESERTLYHIVRSYLKSKDKNAKVFIVHRLDKDTSGIVVLAKDEKTKKLLQDNWNEFVTLREYVAVVHGHLKNNSGRIIQKLSESKTHFVFPSNKVDAKEAITNYKVIKENSNYSLVSVIIETGRKNQIRVAFNTMGNPIVGDKKYSKIKDNENRLYLHANRLKLYYPIIKKDILFEIANPQEFKKIMGRKNEKEITYNN